MSGGHVVIDHRNADGSLITPDLPGGTEKAFLGYLQALQHMRQYPPPYEKMTLDGFDSSDRDEFCKFVEAWNQVIARAVELGIEEAWPDETGRMAICRVIAIELGVPVAQGCVSCGFTDMRHLHIP